MTTSLASQHRCGPARETAVVQIPCCYFANAASHSQGVPATRTAFWSCTRARAQLQRGQEMETSVASYVCGRRLVVRQSYGETCSPLRSQSEHALPHDAGTACTRPCLAFPAVHAMCVGSLVSRSAGHREVVNTLAKESVLAPYLFTLRFRLHACVHLSRRCPTGFGSERS